jgi:hypothetical protein
MTALTVYRILLIVRGSWSVLEWFFDWLPHPRLYSLSLLHPFVALLVGAFGEALFLALILGLWFFQRWARLLFVVLLAIAIFYSVFQPYYSISQPHPFVHAGILIMVILNGAIIAMCFLPPVRERFASQS